MFVKFHVQNLIMGEKQRRNRALEINQHLSMSMLF